MTRGVENRGQTAAVSEAAEISKRLAIELDLPHMIEVQKVLRATLSEGVSSFEEGWKTFRGMSEEDQRSLVLTALSLAEGHYEEQGNGLKLKSAQAAIENFDSLLLSDLLEGLGFIEPEKKNNGGFFGFLRRH